MLVVRESTGWEGTSLRRSSQDKIPRCKSSEVLCYSRAPLLREHGWIFDPSVSPGWHIPDDWLPSAIRAVSIGTMLRHCLVVVFSVVLLPSRASAVAGSV